MNGTIRTVTRFFYPTCDDWSPCFPRQTVQVSLTAYSFGMFRMVVRGADDTSLEKDIRLPPGEMPAKEQELLAWLQNRLPNPLSKAWLREQGFIPG